MQISGSKPSDPRVDVGRTSIRMVLLLAGLLGLMLIVIASVIPANVQVRTGAAKELEHFGAYGLVAVLLALGSRDQRQGLILTALLLGMAASLETIQQWVPGRTASLADWEASAAGSAIGALGVHLPALGNWCWRKEARPREKPPPAS